MPSLATGALSKINYFLALATAEKIICNTAGGSDFIDKNTMLLSLRGKNSDLFSPMVNFGDKKRRRLISSEPIQHLYQTYHACIQLLVISTMTIQCDISHITVP